MQPFPVSCHNLQRNPFVKVKYLFMHVSMYLGRFFDLFRVFMGVFGELSLKLNVGTSGNVGYEKKLNGSALVSTFARGFRGYLSSIA